MSSILWSLPALAAGRQLYDGWAVSLVTAPEIEPVDIATAKLHCRIDSSAEDTILAQYISAAREHCEKITGLSFITQEWDFWLATWPRSDRIRLPFPPLQGLEFLKFTDLTETVSVVSPSIYVVQNGVRPAEVSLRFGQIWPPTPLSPSWPVNARFTSGFGDDADSVPIAIRQAILMLVGHWYENREGVMTGRSVTSVEVQLGIDRLLAPYRVSQHGFAQLRAQY